MRGLLFPYLFARVFSGPSFEDVALQFHASFIYYKGLWLLEDILIFHEEVFNSLNDADLLF